MEEKEILELMASAHQSFLTIKEASSEKDVKKTAFRCYAMIKKTYGLAKEANVYERDKEKMDDQLGFILGMVKMMFLAHGWDTDMMDEFDKILDGLWSDKCPTSNENNETN